MQQEMIILTAFKYIAELEEFDLRNRIVIPCLNEDGYRTLLIKNSKEKNSSYNLFHKILSDKEKYGFS